MREIVLATWEDLPRRVDNIVRSLEIIYQIKFRVDSEEIPLELVYPTKDFLENDKLALVFMKIFRENYDVPIIVVQSGKGYFVLGGHHRSFIRKKLMGKTIKAHVLRFPQGARYRDISKSPLDDLRIKQIGPIEDPILKAWQLYTLIEHYDAIYHIPFYLRRGQIDLEDLVPTQPHVGKTQVDAIKELLVPIFCTYDRKKYYILDIHARSLRAKELGLDSIEALVLLPKFQISFGIMKTTADMNLQSLEDIKIVE